MADKEIFNPAFLETTSHKGVYFEVRKGTYLVPGISRAAICDTNTGSVYSINRSAQEVALGLNKDDVLVCQDCEYRYVCFDCRPISEGAACGNGDYKTAPYPRCTYDPYEGVWGGGTWKVDDEGKPYYDESLKAIIEKVRNEGVSSKPQGHS